MHKLQRILTARLARSYSPVNFDVIRY